MLKKTPKQSGPVTKPLNDLYNMKVMIEIDCETISELHTHLNVLKKQIRQRCKKEKLNPQKDEFPNNTYFSDCNCYGEQYTHIYED